MRQPDAQLRANHRPAALIPPGTHPGHVVVVQAPPRSYGGLILLTVTISAGASAVLIAAAFAFQTIAAAAAAVVPTLGGIGVTVRLAKNKH
ncbi:hypothetical protein [Streptomyces sp. NPDC048639]|uniref:hypothetical protein n=1 Tax=Streptomyces sp. NPDC048639 TaxID=3365581 RepID=UPI0037171916